MEDSGRRGSAAALLPGQAKIAVVIHPGSWLDDANKTGCDPRSPRGCRPAAVGPPHRRVGAATPGRAPVFLVGRARQRQDDESGALSLGDVRDAMAIVIELRARAIRSPTVPSAHAKWWSTSLAAPPTKERARAPSNLARTRLAALGDVLHDRGVEHSYRSRSSLGRPCRRTRRFYGSCPHTVVMIMACWRLATGGWKCAAGQASADKAFRPERRGWTPLHRATAPRWYALNLEQREHSSTSALACCERRACLVRRCHARGSIPARRAGGADDGVRLGLSSSSHFA